MKGRKKSVSGRLFIIALISIGMIFVFILTGLNRIKIKWMSDTARMQQTIVANQANDFDSELTYLYASQQAVLTDTKLNLLMYSSNSTSQYEKKLIFNHIESLCRQMVIKNWKVKKVTFYIYPLMIAIQNRGGSIRKIQVEEFEHLLQINEERSKGIIEDGDELVILRYQENPSPDCIVKVELNQRNMEASFRKNLMYEESNYLFYIPDRDFCITNLEDSGLLDAVKSRCVKLAGEGYLSYEGRRYLVLKAELTNTNGYYVHIIPEKQILKQFSILTGIILGIMIMVVVLLVLWWIGIRHIISKPMKCLIGSFERVEKGDLSARIENMRRDEFYLLYQGFNHMAASIQDLIERDYKHRLLLQKTEIRQLQSQINPHFLYNAFFLLQRVIKGGDQETAQEMSKELGEYFRYITNNAQDMVSLEEEYRHAAIYCHIQGRRFQYRIHVEIEELPDKWKTRMVPKLILQPFIENSFNYGLENKMENGIIRIRFREEENYIVIVIEDNGDELEDDMIEALNRRIEGKDGERTENVSAIVNIDKRLRLTYGENSKVKIKRSELGGMMVEISLSSLNIVGG